MAAAAGSSKGICARCPSKSCDVLIRLQASLASDDESTIKVAPKKETKDKPNGTIKLKKPAPKHNKPGNWRDGSVIDGMLDIGTL
jgi:SAGA-associated factor 73